MFVKQTATTITRIIQALSDSDFLHREDGVIGANGNEVLQTWVDASYAVHRDMLSHTGATILLGHGTIHHHSAKKN